MNYNGNPAQNVLIVDTETFSTVDIKKAGAVKYAENAELILAGFSLNSTYAYYDFVHQPTIPNWVHDHINRGGKVAAHNALFDYCILKPHLPNLQLNQMIDTMAVVAAHSLPLGLGKAADALNLGVSKYSGGTRLITKFCTPRKPSKYNDATRVMPDNAVHDWKEFRDVYLHDDVKTVEAILNKLGPLPEEEQQIWVDTQEINLRGIPIDKKVVDVINGKLFSLIDDESTAFIRMTGLYPTQRDKILTWCKENGCKLLNLQAPTVEKAIASDKTPDIVRKALLTRATISHMSFKKIQALPNIICDDNTVKGTLMYHVAGTGRFGGRLFQPQNLTRGSIDGEVAIEKIYRGEFSVELVKSSVRPVIYHPDGLSIADYSSIEARIVQWVARDEAALEIFRQGMDSYKHMASKIYAVPYEEVTKKQRFTGKQAILGLGYSMSAKKFKLMVENYGEHIEMAEAQLAVDTYRNTYRKLVRFWSSINSCAVMAMQRPGKSIRVNRHVSFKYDSEFLKMFLPSGRTLKYYLPELSATTWGEMGVTYLSMNDRHQYVRTHTYGGKLTENLVQATARDILTGAITSAKRKGFDIIFHVHDEIVAIGQDRLGELIEVMCVLPEWAEGLPLEAEGFTSMRFKK